MANALIGWLFLIALWIGCHGYLITGSDVVSRASATSSHFPLPAKSLCAQLIQPAGYSCSEHTVQTRDGYLCALQRVSSQSGQLSSEGHPPVLLQHGLLVGGESWFLNSRDQSLGFILADHGFDVWVANARGTRWSHGHISLSHNSKEFWDWSWEEMAQYDLADMLHFIHALTGSRVLYVGHSQGTITALAGLTQPHIARLVEAAALLSPISYLEHITSPFILKMVDTHADQVMMNLGMHQFNYKSKAGLRLLDYLCDYGLNCAHLLASITGDNCCFNDSRVGFYLGYEPHPTSIKNLNHLFQMIRRGTFARYDYGVWRNIRVYGRTRPVGFDLTLIPARLWFAYGGDDALADLVDFRRTLSELLNCRPQLLYLKHYAHLDFILSTSAYQDVYRHLIHFFGSPSVSPR